jgi:hypothetical protein
MKSQIRHPSAGAAAQTVHADRVEGVRPVRRKVMVAFNHIVPEDRDTFSRRSPPDTTAAWEARYNYEATASA